MQQIIKALDSFAEMLKDKGYGGTFQTATGHPENLKDSISQYLHDSLLGKEKGLTNSFFLTTYLEWNGEGHPSITADLKTRYHNGTFEVSEMILEYRDRYGKPLRKKESKIQSIEDIPDRKAALALVKKLVHQKNTMRKRSRF